LANFSSWVDSSFLRLESRGGGLQGSASSSSFDVSWFDERPFACLIGELLVHQVASSGIVKLSSLSMLAGRSGISRTFKCLFLLVKMDIFKADFLLPGVEKLPVDDLLRQVEEPSQLISSVAAVLQEPDMLSFFTSAASFRMDFSASGNERRASSSIARAKVCKVRWICSIPYEMTHRQPYVYKISKVMEGSDLHSHNMVITEKWDRYGFYDQVKDGTTPVVASSYRMREALKG
jgi:hypothetical protein